MIEYGKGSIFDSNTEVLVNPVNCVGVMGKGLALEFKKRYPLMFDKYKIACGKGLYYAGCVRIYSRDGVVIFNAATKKHWRDSSNIEDVEYCIVGVYNAITEYKYKSIAIPAIGCGLGGLSWSDVESFLIKHLSGIDC